MKSSPLVITAMTLAIVVAVMAQLTHVYVALTNNTTATIIPSEIALTTTNTSVIKQYNLTEIYVLIIDYEGHVITSYLINGSKIITAEGIERITINNSLDYYVLAINTASHWFGYIKVPGNVLNEVIRSGNYTLYSWTISNVKLKPLNQYPRSSLGIIIKAPNGELIKGGTLCIHPMINGSSQCIEVTTGIVKFSNLTIEPYLVFYEKEFLVNFTTNIYGYTVNTALTVYLTGQWILIPNNGTVAVVPSVFTQRYAPSGYYLYEPAVLASPAYAVKIEITTISLTSLFPPRLFNISYIVVALMLIASILGGVIALLIVPRTIRK